MSGRSSRSKRPPGFFSKVVGVTFDGRAALVARLKPGEQLKLVRDPHNPHDENAIKVVRSDGAQLGHVVAETAYELARTIDRGEEWAATVVEVTGREHDNLGVNIYLHPATYDVQLSGITGRLPRRSAASGSADFVFRAVFVLLAFAAVAVVVAMIVAGP